MNNMETGLFFYDLGMISQVKLSPFVVCSVQCFPSYSTYWLLSFKA